MVGRRTSSSHRAVTPPEPAAALAAAPEARITGTAPAESGYPCVRRSRMGLARGAMAWARREPRRCSARLAAVDVGEPSRHDPAHSIPIRKAAACGLRGNSRWPLHPRLHLPVPRYRHLSGLDVRGRPQPTRILVRHRQPIRRVGVTTRRHTSLGRKLAYAAAIPDGRALSLSLSSSGVSAPLGDMRCSAGPNRIVPGFDTTPDGSPNDDPSRRPGTGAGYRASRCLVPPTVLRVSGSSRCFVQRQEWTHLLRSLGDAGSG